MNHLTGHEVLHISPHFAPGRCGISDYVLQWQEATGEEHPFRVLALHDRFLQGEQGFDNGYRLGCDTPVSRKIEQVSAALRSGPVAVVFHYVPMGYQARGLPYWLFRLSPMLKAIQCPLIILLHEVWAGGKEKPVLLQLKGLLQKQLLLRWLRSLGSPRLITTSAHTAGLLRNEGFVADACPVFNNLGTKAGISGLSEEVVVACSAPHLLRVVLFASLPHEGSPSTVALLLKRWASAFGLPIQVWHLGQGYPQGWWERVKDALHVIPGATRNPGLEDGSETGTPHFVRRDDFVRRDESEAVILSKAKNPGLEDEAETGTPHFVRCDDFVRRDESEAVIPGATRNPGLEDASETGTPHFVRCDGVVRCDESEAVIPGATRNPGIEDEVKTGTPHFVRRDDTVRPDISFNALGPLPAPAINYLMRHAHFGISTYPWQLWSKSGSIAAMRANGLPVMVTGKLYDTGAPAPGQLPAGLQYAGTRVDFKNFHHQSSPGILNNQSNQDLSVKSVLSVSTPDVWYNPSIASTLYALTGVGRETQSCPPYSVVMTVYKSWAKALICLEHLVRFCSEDPVAEIIIVQDEPGAPTPGALQQFDKVILVHNKENLGYVKSVNKGISMATCERVVLLDSDAWVQNSLAPLVNILGRETGVVLASPQGVNEKGVKTRMFFPAPLKWSLVLGQKLEARMQDLVKRPQVVTHSYAWGIFKPAWDALGGLDENYRFIESDIDYCLRVQRQYPGGLAFCPASVVQHEGGSSFFRKNERVLEWHRCRFYTYRKYFGTRYIPFLKMGVSIRLTFEKGLAAFLSVFEKSNQKIWQQKKEGRSELLSNLHSW